MSTEEQQELETEAEQNDDVTGHKRPDMSGDPDFDAKSLGVARNDKGDGDDVEGHIRPNGP